MTLKQGKKAMILVAPLLQILSQLRLLLHDLLIHQKTISLLPQQIKKSSHRGRDQRSRPPKSQSPKNRGLLSPQNLPKSKATKEDSGEVALSFPPNSSVRNKEGWDDVYSELSKLEFEYDKAALESLGRKEAFKKAVRHQMKVFSLKHSLTLFCLFNIKCLIIFVLLILSPYKSSSIMLRRMRTIRRHSSPRGTPL